MARRKVSSRWSVSSCHGGGARFKRQCFAGVISLDLITAVASGRVDLGECEQVEIDDGLECLRSGAVAQAVGQSAEPISVLGL